MLNNENHNYLTQTGTDSAQLNEILFSNGNRFGQMRTDSVTPVKNALEPNNYFNEIDPVLIYIWSAT